MEGMPEYFIKAPDRVKKVLERVDYVQTPSLYLKEFFGGKGFSIEYLPNSIDLSLFPYSNAVLNSHSLLWVRAFADIYNPNTAVKILYEVKKKYHDATLTMIGPDKGILHKTEKLINQLGLKESVIIKGPVSNDKLYPYYHSHSVFLNTSSYESFGVAVLEAASCGIPVVSAKIGEIPFLWRHEENILMVDNLNPIQFAREVFKIFSDPQLADILSKNARKKAEEFDWELIRERWVRLFSE
jgi:glycosyltransferase involved in cell wall biosynthesis